MKSKAKSNESLTSEKHELAIQETIPEEELFPLLAHHDFGLALERSSPKNRDLCRTNKLYSYPLAGCYTLLSKTAAQSQFNSEHSEIGQWNRTSINPEATAEILRDSTMQIEPNLPKKECGHIRKKRRINPNWKPRRPNFLKLTSLCDERGNETNSHHLPFIGHLPIW